MVEQRLPMKAMKQPIKLLQSTTISILPHWVQLYVYNSLNDVHAKMMDMIEVAMVEAVVEAIVAVEAEPGIVAIHVAVVTILEVVAIGAVLEEDIRAAAAAAVVVVVATVLVAAAVAVVAVHRETAVMEVHIEVVDTVAQVVAALAHSIIHHTDKMKRKNYLKKQQNLHSLLVCSIHHL